MERQNGDSLSIQGWSENINKNKSVSGRSRGRSKSLRKHVKVCWKCENEGNYKNEYISKGPMK